MTSRESQIEQWDRSETPNESIPQISQELHEHGCNRSIHKEASNLQVNKQVSAESLLNGDDAMGSTIMQGSCSLSGDGLSGPGGLV